MNIVLDSNILLHYKWFEDIPWSEEIGCDTLTIVFTSIVMEEIDKVKDEEKGKVQKRAKSVSSKLGEILIEEKQGKYQVKYIESPYTTENDKRQYNLDRNDNQILFAVLKSGIDTNDVCVVSSDNAMLMRAKQFGFKIHRINEKYRVQEELTKEEKEAKAAIAELERIKNRLPDPKLFFDIDNIESNHIQIQRSVPYDVEAVVRNKMDALKAQWPMKTIEDDQFFILGQTYNALTPDQVISYNSSREDFLKNSEEKIRLETQRDDLDQRMAHISIAVYNAGTAPTGKMNIFLQIPDNIRFYEKRNKKHIKYKEPPKPNTNPLFNQISISINVPVIEIWDLDAYCRDKKMSKATESLTHNLKHTVFDFYVDSATCPNFQMQWCIIDAELADPIKGELNVCFVDLKRMYNEKMVENIY